MAIKKVEASLAGTVRELTEREGGVFSEELTVPKASGNYGLEMAAYDDAGNIVVANASNTANMTIEVSKWHTPKVNWAVTDRFLYQGPGFKDIIWNPDPDKTQTAIGAYSRGIQSGAGSAWYRSLF